MEKVEDFIEKLKEKDVVSAISNLILLRELLPSIDSYQKRRFGRIKEK